MAKHPNPLPESIDYLTDTETIEHRRIPLFARSTLYILLAFLITAVLWATFSKIDRVVTTRGILTSTSETMVLQPFVTSVIRTIHVHQGDVVRKNQLLVSFDSTFATADLEELKHEVIEQSATVARLNAELLGKNELPEDFDDDIRHAHSSILTERIAQHKSKLRQFGRSILQYRSDHKASRENQTILRKRLASANEVESMENQLSKDGTGSRLKLLVAKDKRLAVQNELKNAINNERSIKHGIAALEAERDVYEQNWRRTVNEELSAARTKKHSIEQQISKAERLATLSELLAPADGIVLEVAQQSAGSVARQAEPLITLVPLDTPLEAQIRILAKDIGYIRPNDETRVKIDAFPYQKHGTLKGVLRVTSEGVFDDKGRASNDNQYYEGRVTLNSSNLKHAPQGARLIPGMSLSAEIVVGDRSIISYFLYPLIRTLDESIREP